MNLKERILLEKKEFQVLKKKYSFKNIHRVEEEKLSEDQKKTCQEQQKKTPSKS